VGSWASDRGTLEGDNAIGWQSVSDEGEYLVILRPERDGTWRVATDMDNNEL
jgi:hypothetical protein